MQLKYHQACIFALTWMAYAGTYLLRKPLAVVKTDLSNELSMTKTELGWLDTAMLFPYATVQIVFGSSADKYGPRRTLAVCLLISALSMASFGSWQSFYVYAILLFINGAAQSQAWPSCVKGLGVWYTTQHRNAIFGIWGTCTFAGGVLGTALAVHLQTHHGWRQAFLIPSLLLSGLGLLVLLFLHTPSDYQVTIPGKDLESSTSEKPALATPSFVSLWNLPMLKEVAVSMFCVKIVRYCVFMWLPMYLHQQLHYGKTESGMLPTSFEIGGVIGSASLGCLIQRLLRGQLLLGSGLAILASTLSLVCFLLTASWGAVFNVTLMLIAGAFNCGVDPILSGSVPSEIGEMDGRRIQASVSGFVNGFGSLGTVLQGPMVGAITEYYGWSGMLYLIITLSLLGCIASLKGYLISTRLRQRSTTRKHEMCV
ncbi:putative glycerol-3-phosphate transporter 2 [Acanthaster planci]|uniref:Glycerol-3-phosphate transporter 2 n=1 Tax=Acanthaster planci TaxID=133434 RepID=A0A8B7YYC1_ACAPL|nr:putative glycerol-3-phosphate transporter 2 [Acanthaster planci]